MRHFRKATIKEVAAQAGVSITTVSLFVSGRETVCSPETAERIRGAVTLLHYTPSALTRGLHRRASVTLGACLPNPLEADVTFGSSFFEQLWRGVMFQADQEDYSLLHYPESVRNGLSCDPFLDGRVDGLLLHEHDNRRAPRLAAAGMPTVLLNRSRDLPDCCGTVYAEEAQTVDLALSHLWALGHRRIAHVAGPVGLQTPGGAKPHLAASPDSDDIAVQRLVAYRGWTQARGVFDPALIAYARAWTAPEALAHLDSWLALPEPPTAVFCANDIQALDIYAAVRIRGRGIPADLSVVGVDNSAAARAADPPLTSVEVPIEAIGREAVQSLLRLLHSPPFAAGRIIVPVTHLAIRRSTSAPNR